VHDESGQTYYFNEISGETSWEPPVIENKKKDRLEAEQSEVSSVSEQQDSVTDNTMDEPLTNKEVDSSDIPEVVKESVRNESGEVSHLPKDWTSVVDEDTGKVYFYNVVTGETSWEPPYSDNQASSEFAEISKKSSDDFNKPLNEASQEDQELHGDALEGTPEVAVSLPPGWVTKVDGSTGKMFYHNLETGRNSWEPPSSDSALERKHSDRTEEDINDATENTEIFETQEAVTAEGEDANGIWEVVEDPDSGLTYYYNTHTGETTWENPFVDSEQTAEKHEEVSPPHFSDSEEVSQQPVEDDDGEESHTPQPPLPDDEINPNEKSDRIGDHVDFQGPDNENDDVLPQGWEAMRDPDTGDVYYVNAVEGISSWEKPMILSQDDDLHDDHPYSTDANGDEGINDVVERTEASDNNDEENSLPDNWEKVNDPDTGMFYFYNTLTEETTWDRPVGSNVAAEREYVPSDNCLTDTANVGAADSIQPQDTHRVTVSSNSHLGEQTKWIGRRCGASIGFGGSICFTRGGNIVVHKLSDLVSQDVVVTQEASKARVGIQGSLASAPEDVTAKYISDCAKSAPEDLLWGLVDITSLGKGRTRSQEKHVIVDLLNQSGGVSGDAKPSVRVNGVEDSK
jgi:hypothetical protein